MQYPRFGNELKKSMLEKAFQGELVTDREMNGWNQEKD
jgi:hypothetical protein